MYTPGVQTVLGRVNGPPGGQQSQFPQTHCASVCGAFIYCSTLNKLCREAVQWSM